MTSLINGSSGTTALSGSAALQKIHTFLASSSTRLSSSGGATQLAPIETLITGSSWRYYVVGHATVLAGVPYGSFRDFAHYTSAMPDPAMVLIKAKASGLATLDNGQPSGMRRVWVTAAAPQDYPVSSGYAWRRAAFVSDGVRINALPTNGTQMIDAAQVELTNNATTGPTVYAPARSLVIKVHPDRLNYCTNPMVVFDTTGWGGSMTLTRVDQGDGWAVSVQAVVNANLWAPLGTSLPGQYWSASAVVNGPAGKTVDVRIHDGVGYLSPVNNVVLTGQPMTIPVAGTSPAVGTAIRLYLYPRNTTTKTWSGTDTITMTNVLAEHVGGPNVPPGPYFDGDSGVDYLWETAAVAGNTRSYYYRDRKARTYLLQRLLEENSPLGVIPGTPQFAVLPTQ